MLWSQHVSLGLFIIDGIITVPIGLLGYLFMPGECSPLPLPMIFLRKALHVVPPDLPHNTKPSIFYTQEQLDMAQRRMAKIGRKPPAKFTRAKVCAVAFAVTNSHRGYRAPIRFSDSSRRGTFTLWFPVSYHK